MSGLLAVSVWRFGESFFVGVLVFGLCMVSF